MNRLLYVLFSMLVAGSSFLFAQVEAGRDKDSTARHTYCYDSSSPLELKSNLTGVDFGTYLAKVREDVRRNWFNLIPEVARAPIMKPGKLTVEFAILKDGNLAGLRITESSKDNSLDRAASGGIAASSPFPPLPTGYEGPFVFLRFHFCYNGEDIPPAVTELRYSARTAVWEGNYSLAIQLFHKLLDLDPMSPDSWNQLGGAYAANRQYADAEAAFRRQIEIARPGRFAHQDLAALYLEWQKYEEAASELEDAITIRAFDPFLYIRLGTAYLNLDKDEKAMAAFDHAVQLSDTPSSQNSIAYSLALKGSHLDRAKQYAESAVNARSATLRSLDLDRLTSHDLWLVSSLASYWDTLGWVYFAAKDTQKAEAYVLAAWQLNPTSTISDHLAQIYERRGMKNKAIQLYALAEKQCTPPDPEIHQRLVLLVGGQDKAAEEEAKHRDESSILDTALLTGKGPPNTESDFYVLLSPGPDGPKVEGVKFIDDGGRMKVLEPSLLRSKFNVTFPDNVPTKIIRRGTVSCSILGQCKFVVTSQSSVNRAD